MSREFLTAFSRLREGFGSFRLHLSILIEGFGTFRRSIINYRDSESIEFFGILGSKNQQQLNFFVYFRQLLKYIMYFCTCILQRLQKTYCSIVTQSPPLEYEQTSIMEPTLFRAQASRIYLWFVVNRVTYGDGLRLLR